MVSRSVVRVPGSADREAGAPLPPLRLRLQAGVDRGVVRICGLLVEDRRRHGSDVVTPPLLTLLLELLLGTDPGLMVQQLSLVHWLQQLGPRLEKLNIKIFFQ